MKRLLTAIATAVLAVSAYCNGVAYWNDSAGVTWKFSYLNNSYHEAHIAGAEGYTDTLNIPEKVEAGETQYTVYSIRSDAFKQATGIKTVVMPDSLLTVESGAFNGCTGLTSLKLGSAVDFIGEDAFKGCTGLRSLTIPYGVEEIQGGAFADCTSLSQVKFNGGLRMTGEELEEAFANTPWLANMNANDNWKDAIAVTGLKGSVTACNAIATPENGEPEQTSGKSLWWKWTAPYGTTKAVFHTCGSSFDTILGIYTGTAVDNLETIDVNDDFDGDDVYGSQSLLQFDVTPGQTYYICVAGYNDHDIGDVVLSWAVIDDNGFEFIVSDGVLIGFLGDCPSNLTIPYTVTRIGMGVFAYPDDNPDIANIQSLYIPANVVSIGESAFYDCKNLSQVIFSEGLQFIEDYAFEGCTALAGATIQLPSTLEDVTGHDFADIGGELTLYAPNTLSEVLTSGTYGTTVLTVSYQAVPLSGRTRATLYPEEGEFGIGVPIPEDGEYRTTIQLEKGSMDWGDAISRKPTRAGYVFDGFWTRRASGGVQIWDADMKFVGGNGYWSEGGAWASSSRSLSLYARWKTASVPCTVTFNANGGKVSPTTRQVESGEKLGTLPTATLAGYDFVGWFTTKSGGTQVTSATIVSANVTYYAHWKAKTYTVSFNAISASATLTTKKKSVRYGGTYGELPTPILDGYSFVGWFTERSGGVQVLATTKVTTAADHMLYARWKRVAATCTVTFNANGGTVSPKTRSVTTGAAVGTLPTASLAGYDFVGWFTTKSGGTQVTASTKVSANVTYYAHWKAKTFTVSFNAISASATLATKKKTVRYGGTYGALPAPSLSGYAFVGWFTERSGGTQVLDTTKVTTAADHMLYARWKRK